MPPSGDRGQCRLGLPLASESLQNVAGVINGQLEEVLCLWRHLFHHPAAQSRPDPVVGTVFHSDPNLGKVVAKLPGEVLGPSVAAKLNVQNRSICPKKARCRVKCFYRSFPQIGLGKGFKLCLLSLSFDEL